MSTYATIEGIIQYETEEALDAVLDRLRKGCWIDEDNIWIDETGTKKYGHPDPTVNRSRKTLLIPRDHYRNLLHIENELIEDATYAIIVGSSSDGMFRGWMTTEDQSYEVDLKTWARTRGYNAPDPEMTPYEYNDWKTTVMNEWHDVHGKYPRQL